MSDGSRIIALGKILKERNALSLHDFNELQAKQVPTEALMQALKSVSWQKMLGTDLVDDRLDDYLKRIIAQLGNAFCGFVDPQPRLSPQTYGSPDSRWDKSFLTFSINADNCVGMKPADAISAITEAFQIWNGPNGVPAYLHFSAVPSGGDIGVAFRGTEWDPSLSADGAVLASSTFPRQGGDIGINKYKTWLDHNGLKSVVAHEIGHTLGLTHSNSIASLMFPDAVNPDVTSIDAETREAIAALYGWPAQNPLPDSGSSDKPALGYFGIQNFEWNAQTLRMVWKGVQHDAAIWQADFDGAHWGAQQPIPGIGSSHGPCLTSFVMPDGSNTGMMMVWKGEGDDQSLWWSVCDSVGNWSPQQPVGNVGSSSRPALCTFQGTAFLAWKGINDDHGIYTSTFQNGGWTPQSLPLFGRGTSDGPALATLGSLLFMFWKGLPGDSKIYYASLDPNVGIWGPQAPVSYLNSTANGMEPEFIGTSGSPSACESTDSIFLTWKGISGDSAIYYSVFDGKDFSGQVQIPNTGTSVGATPLHFEGKIYLAWKGVEGDSDLYWLRRL